MKRQEEERTAPAPEFARRAVVAEEEPIGALALALFPPACPPVAPGRDGGHARFRDLLAGASRRDLEALRHLLNCPLCFQLARVVLLELPALELAGSNGRRRRRQQRRHPFHHRS